MISKQVKLYGGYYISLITKFLNYLITKIKSITNTRPHKFVLEFVSVSEVLV